MKYQIFMVAVAFQSLSAMSLDQVIQQAQNNVSFESDTIKTRSDYALRIMQSDEHTNGMESSKLKRLMMLLLAKQSGDEAWLKENSPSIKNIFHVRQEVIVMLKDKGIMVKDPCWGILKGSLLSGLTFKAAETVKTTVAQAWLKKVGHTNPHLFSTAWDFDVLPEKVKENVTLEDERIEDVPGFEVIDDFPQGLQKEQGSLLTTFDEYNLLKQTEAAKKKLAEEKSILKKNSSDLTEELNRTLLKVQKV